jgi:two-component system phosphate regulon sensor histidine kinase PhoR
MVEQLRGVSGLDAAGRAEYLRLIARECRRLGQLIQNVLATRRLESDRREFLAEPLNLGRLVTETLAAFAPQAQEQDVRVVGPVDHLSATGTPNETVYEVLGDSLALQQALTNLLDNALKHSLAGTMISVQLQPVDGGRRVRLSVLDQGPGVPPEDRERIFLRFVRRGSELRRETEGIGLGLALVRRTMELHGGRVWCEAGESNRGARFVLELPLESVPPLGIPSSKTS